MGKIRPIGLIIALIGNALIGYALFVLIQSPSCGDTFQPACSGDVVGVMMFLPVGIILSMIGIFAGGGLIGFAGVFLSIGLGSMAAAAFGSPDPEMPWFGWMFGGMFTFFGMVPLLIAIAAGPTMRKRQQKAADLIAHGRKCVGTIMQVNDTGMTINDNPRVEIVMSAQPIGGGAAVTLRKRVTVSRVAIPRVGERYPVWYDPDHPGNWAYATDCEPNAPAAVKDLFARARSAAHTPESRLVAEASARAPAATARLPLAELERLAALHRSGALSDEEFSAAKARLLG